MNHAPSLELILSCPSPEATADQARMLAPQLRSGDVIVLYGPVGAGKTHFARALIQSRLAMHDAFEDVPSPSFTLVQTYVAGDLEIWHVDLYRLNHPDEVLELGLDEAFARALCVIEWPERIGNTLPAGALEISFADGPDDAARVLTFRGAAPRWAAVFKRLAAQADATREPS